MQLWTERIGFPLVEVKEEHNGKLSVSQSRFLSSGDATAEENETVWWVPLELVDESGKTHSHVLDKLHGEFAKPSTFYKLNCGHKGVYRVAYDETHLKVLGNAIKNGMSSLTNSDRAGLLADTINIAMNGKCSTVALLDLVQHYENETAYLVWSLVSSALSTVKSVWFEEPEFVLAKIDKIKGSLFGNIVGKMGWEFTPNESFMDTQLRSLAISAAGHAGVPSVVAEANRRFNAFIDGNSAAIHPNLRSVVFGIVIHHGSDNEWQAVRKLYELTETEDQKMALLQALGMPKQEHLIKAALDYGFSAQVRSQDLFRLYAQLGSNSKARYQLWQFVKDNWSTLQERYSGSLGILGHVVKAACGNFSSEKMALEVEGFFATVDHNRVERPIMQSVEKVRANAKWLDRQKDMVRQWAQDSKL